MSKVKSDSKKIALAFSGGLDTSFCVVYLKEQGYEVHTVTADTGGFSAKELEQIAERAKEFGAASHSNLDRRAEVYSRFAAYIIKGNILRGGVYPLCVGAERIVQAQSLVEFAKKIGAEAVAHGCTGAGNDQVRFDVEIRCLDPKLKIVAPIRELQLSREKELDFLDERGFKLPRERKTYSVNQGILGTTIGGGATHDSWQAVPDEAYVMTASPSRIQNQKSEIIIGFKQGLPCALNGRQMPGLEILTELNQLGGSFGVGRGMHTGDTILGIKGRVAFEAPGALILINAHRELEKLVLTKWQSYVKEQICQLYGTLVHEGQWCNPAVADMEALIDSSQKAVTGEVRVELKPGTMEVKGVRSDYSLMNSKAVYGEGSSLWSGIEAEGFCKIIGTQSILASNRTGV